LSLAVRIPEVVIILRSMQIPLVAGVLMLAVSACGENFPSPPRKPPIVSPVMISPDGRVITVRAARVCGHRPQLIARSYPYRVTLRLVNPDINCHAEGFPGINVSVTLPDPLGARRLVQASTGKLIRYHVGRSSSGV